tara:strand:- start:190 stop:360 length:171 start_codon:yes stop_codon:yes gene_type:complete
MISSAQKSKMEEIDRRLTALEENSHPPVEWEEKIKKIRLELDNLYKKLKRGGNGLG